MRHCQWILVLLLPIANIFSVEKLPSEYLVVYGSEKAPVKVMEYYSLQCPHCIRLFRTDFPRIKSDFINQEKIQFIFHPIPGDLTTIQAMICMAKLNQFQKQIFLEEIIEASSPGDQELMAKLMIAAMNVFKMPESRLNDHEYIEKHKAFLDSYRFIKEKGEGKFDAVPCVEIDGGLFEEDIPSYEFIHSKIKVS